MSDFEQKVLNFMKFSKFHENLLFLRPGRKRHTITGVFLVFFRIFRKKVSILLKYLNYATFHKKCSLLQKVTPWGTFSTFMDFTPPRASQTLENIRVGAFWDFGSSQAQEQFSPREKNHFLHFRNAKRSARRRNS